MSSEVLLTAPEVARRLNIPTWLARRLMDKLPDGVVRRAGQYRLLPEGDVERVRDMLKTKET